MDALLTAVVSGVIVAIASALLAFYFGGVRERQKREYEQQKEAQKRQEGLTERLTQVTAQLGSNNLETKLGAIYALEAIAKESDAYYWPVMEVLTAYVRQHAPWNPEEVREPAEVRTPALDIQAIMTVLRRRTRSFGHGEPEPLDLNRAYLWGAHLARADLRGADLRRAKHLTQGQLDSTRSGDENPWLPSGLKPPAHWGVKIDEPTEGD
jgi:hypothetical protein